MGIPLACLPISTALLLRRPQTRRLDHDGGMVHRSGGMAIAIKQLMTNPLWLLVPWLVFAFGAGIKLWRLIALFRRHLLGLPTRTERFRQALERLWEQDQQVA